MLWAFKDIEELILCKNDLSDIENVQEDKVNLLQQLNFLNLEETNQNSFEAIQKFGKLPKLEKLIINKNGISEIGTITGFPFLKHLSVQFCAIENPVVLYQISKFTEL